MKLTICDLLWCVLLIAGLTHWFVEHRRAAQRIEELWKHSVFHVAVDPRPWQSEYQQRRLAVVQRIARLSDKQLDARLSAIVLLEHPWEADDLEPCLAEMQRRSLASQLERHYRAYLERPSDRLNRENVQWLTALRRSQGRPDPLRIELAIATPAANQEFAPPRLAATFTNVDADRDTLCFVIGGDYRSGRPEKWRIELTDERGRRAKDSNFGGWGGGGLGSFGPLEAGESRKNAVQFDLRCFAAPPRSGKYRLQAYYHSSEYIADTRDLTGLIVARSDPILVTVHNPQERKVEWFPAKIRPIFAILAAGALLAAMSRLGAATRRSPTSTTDAVMLSRWRRMAGLVPRDACWGALVVAAALGFWLDQHVQDARIASLTPDSEAEWTMTIDQDRGP